MWHLATSILTVAWMGSSQSSRSSLKLVLKAQLSEVEMSVIGNRWFSLLNLPAMMSIHEVINDAV